MQQPEVYQNLVTNLRSAIGVLEFDKNSQLYRDAVSICNYLEDPIFRIAVFAPFNYGKSTLLNAIGSIPLWQIYPCWQDIIPIRHIAQR